QGAAAPAPLVELLREHLLAGAALAEDHHREVGPRDAPERGGQALDLIAAHDPTGREVGPRLAPGLREDGAVDPVAGVALRAPLDELEDRVAHADLVVVLEDSLQDEAAVDEGPVPPAEVVEHPSPLVLADAGVLPGHGAPGDRDAHRRIAPDGE